MQPVIGYRIRVAEGDGKVFGQHATKLPSERGQKVRFAAGRGAQN